MQRSLSFTNQSKGFVFSLEVLIALVIFASFIQIAYFNESIEENYLDEFSFRELVSNSLIVLDENGTALDLLDSNIPNDEKVSAIYEQIKSLLPKNASLFIRVTAFDTNSTKCAVTRAPEDCFAKTDGFNELGPSPPLNKNVEHSQIVLASKIVPQECRIEAVFSPNFFRERKILFEEKKERVFFEGETDLNLFFDVNSTPSSEAICGQDIVVDMSVSVPDYNLIYGRNSADVSLILDRSGSMDEVTVSKGKVGSNTVQGGEIISSNIHLSSGSFNEGTKSSFFGYCFNYGNWKNLYSLVVDENIASSTSLSVIMSYSGYAGQCGNPRLRILAPNSSYLPSSKGVVGSNGTATVNIGSPISQGTYVIQGWSDESINYDINLASSRMISWVKISDYSPDPSTVGSPKSRFSFSYSNYQGSYNSPKFRIKLPNGSYVPSAAGAGGVSPISININPLADGNYALEGWSDSNINVDVNLHIQKLFVAKQSANYFIDYQGWKSEYDQMSLVSFSTTALIEQQLVKMTNGNKSIIKNKIYALTPNGNTAIGDAITLAKNELTSTRAIPNSIRFEVLLSDGQNNTGSNPITAAQSAKDNNIKIYTIGFGSDADHDTLNDIAELTGGKYYRADDQNGLSEVFELIAIDIGESIGDRPSEIALDTNLMMPVPKCDYVTQAESGFCTDFGDSNYLYYLIGDINTPVPWNGSFTLNIPCESSDACSFDKLLLPFLGTKFYWKDTNNLTHSTNFDKNVLLDFKYRDLSLNILSAYAVGTNLVSLDINSKNSGKLDTNSTTIDFLINDPNSGTLVGQESIESLRPGEFKLILNERLNASNWIYAVINRDKIIKECPGNNIASVYCEGVKKNKFYVIDVWAWLD